MNCLRPSEPAVALPSSEVGERPRPIRSWARSGHRPRSPPRASQRRSSAASAPPSRRPGWAGWPATSGRRPHAQAGVRPGQLLYDEDVAEEVGVCPPVLFRDAYPHESEPAELGQNLHRKVALPVPTCGRRRDLVGGERPCHSLDIPLLGAQIELHGFLLLQTGLCCITSAALHSG